LVQTVLKEVTGARHNYQLHRGMLFELVYELAHGINIAKLIEFAMDQKHRLAAIGEEAKTVFAQRRANANQLFDPLIFTSDA
jgi:hypothetical protein